MFPGQLLFLSTLELIRLFDKVKLFLSLDLLLNLEQVLKAVLFLTRSELCLLQICLLILSKQLADFAGQTECSTDYRRLRRTPRFFLG